MLFPLSPADMGVLNNSKSFQSVTINIALIHKKESNGWSDALVPFLSQRCERGYIKIKRGEQAQAHVTCRLDSDRLYTSHLFAADILAVD